MVRTELESLLAVQAHDGVVRTIDARREAALPRLQAAESAARQVMETLAKTEQALERDMKRLQGLEARVTERRASQEQLSEALGHAERIDEAAVVAQQLESVRRALAGEEAELATAIRRVSDLRKALVTQRETKVEAEARLAQVRTELEPVLAEVAREREAAMTERGTLAATVGRTLLALYEKVQARRRDVALFPVSLDFTCSACDTAIPMQRRTAFSGRPHVEPCEACGVLVYTLPGT